MLAPNYTFERTETETDKEDIRNSIRTALVA